MPRKHVLLIPEPTRARGTLLSALIRQLLYTKTPYPYPEKKVRQEATKKKEKNLYIQGVTSSPSMYLLKKISCSHVFQRDGPRDGSPDLLKCSHPYPRVRNSNMQKVSPKTTENAFDSPFVIYILCKIRCRKRESVTFHCPNGGHAKGLCVKQMRLLIQKLLKEEESTCINKSRRLPSACSIFFRELPWRQRGHYCTPTTA